MVTRRKAVSRKSKSTLAFNHAMIYVADVDRALHFYRDLLGFKLLDINEGNGVRFYARLRAPAGLATIALHRAEPGQVLPDSAGIRLYFEVRSLDALCRKLEREDVKFSQMPKKMFWGGATLISTILTATS